MKSLNSKNPLGRAKETLLFLSGMAIAFSFLGCATMKGEIRVDVALPETTYISPKNADGIQDTLTVPAEFLTAEKIQVRGYRLTVLDLEGNGVRTIEATLEKPKRALFAKNKKSAS